MCIDRKCFRKCIDIFYICGTLWSMHIYLNILNMLKIGNTYVYILYHRGLP